MNELTLKEEQGSSRQKGYPKTSLGSSGCKKKTGLPMAPESVKKGDKIGVRRE